ncbi:MAG: hypothetical protein V4722_05635 [Bacteroidota bacterium]
MFKRDFYNLLSKIATVILTLYALFTLPVDVVEKTKSTALGIVLAAMLSLILGIGTLYHFSPPFTLKRFGVRRHKTNPILANSTNTIDIDENFVASITKNKKIIFPEKPTPDDLVDLIEVSNIDKLDEGAYFAKDARVTKFVRRRKNTLAIYWQPLQEILPNTIYNHICGYISPSLYGDDAFWHTCYADLNTGIVSYQFNCKKDVEMAIAFLMPYFSTTINYKKLDKLAFIKNRRDCPQPIISSDNKTVSWTLINPKRHRSYLCFVFYENGVKSFRSIIKYNWLERLVMKQNSI